MSRKRGRGGGGLGGLEDCKLEVGSWVLGKVRIHDRDVKQILQVVADLCKRMKKVEEEIGENRSSYGISSTSFSAPLTEPSPNTLADEGASCATLVPLKVSLEANLGEGADLPPALGGKQMVKHGNPISKTHLVRRVSKMPGFRQATLKKLKQDLLEIRFLQKNHISFEDGDTMFLIGDGDEFSDEMIQSGILRGYKTENLGDTLRDHMDTGKDDVLPDFGKERYEIDDSLRLEMDDPEEEKIASDALFFDMGNQESKDDSRTDSEDDHDDEYYGIFDKPHSEAAFPKGEQAQGGKPFDKKVQDSISRGSETENLEDVLDGFARKCVITNIPGGKLDETAHPLEKKIKGCNSSYHCFEACAAKPHFASRRLRSYTTLEDKDADEKEATDKEVVNLCFEFLQFLKDADAPQLQTSYDRLLATLPISPQDDRISSLYEVVKKAWPQRDHLKPSQLLGLLFNDS